MKKIILAFLLIAAISGCNKQDPDKASSTTDSTFVPPDLANDEVEVHEEHPRYLSRGQAEPDFWNPNYRSYKIMPIYVEVANDLVATWGANTDANVTKLIQNSSNIMERLAGPKMVIVKMKKHFTPDPYAGISSAGTILYQWSATVPARGDTFSVFITGRNIGGIAFISRENVISTKYAVCGLGSYIIGDDRNFSFPVYCVTHEVSHLVGISHSQNDCSWRDKAGNRLGRLDSCYSCESTCTPKMPNCNGSTKGQDGHINSYCHLYGRTKYTFHPVVLPVLHRALFYSTLPDYTPNQPPPTPTNTFSISGTPYTGYTRADTAKAIDGNESTRFLTTGSTTLTWTFAVPTTRTSVYMSSGYQGGSPNQTLTLTVDGVNVPLGYVPNVKFTKAINVTGKRFVLTTTGTGNISRVFEIQLK